MRWGAFWSEADAGIPCSKVVCACFAERGSLATTQTRSCVAASRATLCSHAVEPNMDLGSAVTIAVYDSRPVAWASDPVAST